MQFANFKLLLQSLQSKPPELEFKSLKPLEVRKLVHLDISVNYAAFLPE